MTPADYTAIERALTDEVLDTAYTQAGWLTAAHQFEKTGWAEVKQKKAAVMRAVLLEAIRRALPAEGERTCVSCVSAYGTHSQYCRRQVIRAPNVPPAEFGCTLYAPTGEPERP